MTKVHPIGNLVVLAPVKHNRKSPGGLVLLEKYNPVQQIWRVLEVGPGKLRKGRRIPHELKTGDKVVTAQIPNNRHVFSDGVMILDADEILARIEPDSHVPQELHCAADLCAQNDQAEP